MIDFTQEEIGPSLRTLEIIRQFAYNYQPSTERTDAGMCLNVN